MDTKSSKKFSKVMMSSKAEIYFLNFKLKLKLISVKQSKNSHILLVFIMLDRTIYDYNVFSINISKLNIVISTSSMIKKTNLDQDKINPNRILILKFLLSTSNDLHLSFATLPCHY